MPLSTYFGVAGALLVLTGITVYVALDINFGAGNLVIAILIAATKATLVALFFMHLRYDNKLYMTIFVGGVLFLSLFIIFTMFDTMNRGDIYTEVQKEIRPAEIYLRDSTATDSSHVSGIITDSTAAPTGQHGE